MLVYYVIMAELKGIQIVYSSAYKIGIFYWEDL